MKRKVTLGLILMAFCLSFAGCGGSALKNLSKDSNDTSDVFKDLTDAFSDLEAVTDDITGEDYDEMMKALDQLSGGADERLGKEYYRFPVVTTWSELPDASVWKEMGMIDLTPDEYNEGMVYDDGTTIIDGMWNGFTISCNGTSKETFKRIVQKLWDAGYRGVPVGNGTIVEADGLEDVYHEYDNLYLAVYEHDGWLLAVNAVFYEPWDEESDGSVLLGVYDAKTMVSDYPDLRVWPKIDWSVTKEAVPPDLNLKQLGSDLHGNWGEFEIQDYYDTYTYETYEIYAYNVKKSEFENYLNDIESQGYSPDFEDEGESWQAWYVYYRDYYNNFYGFYLYYNEKAGEVCWVWDS